MMRPTTIVNLVLLTAVITSSGCGAQKKSDASPTRAAQSASNKPEGAPATTAASGSASAIERARSGDRFLLMLFYQEWDGAARSMADSVVSLMPRLPRKTDTVSVNVTDPAERAVVERYGAQQAGLPLLLVIAPNGVVTGGYPGSVSGEQLQQGVGISDLMLSVLKPLQEQKVTLVALQNAATRFNAESWKGVSDFVKDTSYAQFATAIKADPGASGSQEFLKQCQLIAPLTEATVVVVLPPGRIGKVFSGKTTKADILKALQACTAGSGCCPSDKRFKTDVAALASSLDKVCTLQGVSYVWNRADFPERFFPEGRQIGFLAQDVEVVYPEVVHTDNLGYKSVAYDKLTAAIVEAVKEMKRTIDRQDSLIQAQDARIRSLEGRAQ